MYKTALDILNFLNNLGYEAYIVGGFARDKYLGICSNDIDICTNAKPDELKNLFKIIQDNSKYGSVLIKKNNFEFEITTFREDTYENSRYPKVVFVDTLEKDLLRRDFIINTLCIDYKGEFIDLMGAKKDLDNKIINCIGDCDKKFKEDPIRMLRAKRFSNKLNFKLSNEIIEAIDMNKHLLKNINKKRVFKEINKNNLEDIL